MQSGKSGMFVNLLAAVFACLAVVFVSMPATAQTLSEAEGSDIATQLEPLLDKAREDGLNVIIVGPAKKDVGVKEDGPSFRERALKIRTELQRIIPKAPELPSAIYTALKKRSPDGTFNWLWIAIATAVGGLALGYAISYSARSWSQRHFRTRFSEEVETRAEKISYLMFRAFVILVNVCIAGAIAGLVAIVFDSGHEPSYGTIAVIIVAYLSYRIFRHVIFFNLIAPDVPTHRMINLDDETAELMQTHWRNIAMVVIIICAFFVWLAILGLPADPLKLLVIASLLLCAIIMAWAIHGHRGAITDIVLGSGEPTKKSAARRLLASGFPTLLVVYLATAWFVSVGRIMLNLPSALAIIAAPVVAAIACIAIYSLLLIVIDRLYHTRQRRFEERVALAQEHKQLEQEAAEREMEAARLEHEASGDDVDLDDEQMIINEVMSANNLDEMPVFKPVFKTIFEEAAGVLVVIAGLTYILAAWDVNVGEQGHPVTAFIDTLVIAFLGWFSYRAVVVYIDNQLAEEGDDSEALSGEPGEEMSGKSASRLGTLLPLLRNVLIAAIIIFSAMIILSNIGVDIAPLFAGAGVIGLAVGFGAQTLIRDIFSGGFFLFDDAFRKGEYIEMENIRGTVEKISLRSFQLRHHNGPLHTVPFGEIKQLTNYSRDWVMMKLPLRLTYDTDVERVRKLVKKLGQRLMEHTEVGHLFLQPLKSQGVYKMEDSAMIIRIKFMTKPGDQFVTRKVVYASIRDLFEQEDIRFASKEVTVRLADEPAKPLTKAEKGQIAAAARRVHDDEAEAQAGTPSKADDGP